MILQEGCVLVQQSQVEYTSQDCFFPHDLKNEDKLGQLTLIREQIYPKKCDLATINIQPK